MRFKAEATLVREVNGLRIIFWDRETIYVYEQGARYGTIFNRWFTPRGFYESNWQPFRRKVLRMKNPTIPRLFELAAAWDVLANRTDRQLDLSQKQVKVLRE